MRFLKKKGRKFWMVKKRAESEFWVTKWVQICKNDKEEHITSPTSKKDNLIGEVVSSNSIVHSGKIKTAKWQLSAKVYVELNRQPKWSVVHVREGVLFHIHLTAKRGTVYLCAEHLEFEV